MGVLIIGMISLQLIWIYPTMKCFELDLVQNTKGCLFNITGSSEFSASCDGISTLEDTLTRIKIEHPYCFIINNEKLSVSDYYQQQCNTNRALLRKIEIINSNIIDLTIETFTSVSEVNTLVLKRNHLTKILGEYFNSLSLISLDLSLNNITSIDRLKLPYIQYLNLSSNRLLDDVWFNLLSMSNLIVLDLNNNYIKHLIDLNNKFDSLTVLLIDNNNVLSLGHNEFKNFPLLEHLSLNNNRIKEIENTTFYGLSQLLELRLSNNLIKGTIDRQTLSYLENIKTVDLSNNLISHIDDEALSISTLEYLDLSSNNIGNNLTFANSTNLVYLNLSYNNIKTLKDGAFEGHTSFNILDLTNNSFSSIYFPKEVKHVSELYLANNNIKELKNISSFMGQIEKLFLENNKITDLDTSKLAKIIYLNVSSNELHNIYLLCGSDLEYVDFSYNKIENMVFDKKCPKLRTIQARGNKITNISVINNHDMNSLNHFDFSWNEIRDIGLTFRKLSNVIVINLSNNKIVTLLPGTFSNLTKLNFLSLSNNLIEIIPLGLFSSCNNLQAIDLSNNILKEFDVRMFFNNMHIENLILDNNAIRQIDLADLKKYLEIRQTKLSPILTISIGGNKITCDWIIEAFHINGKKIGLNVDAIEKSFHDNNYNGIPCNETSLSRNGDKISQNYTINHSDMKSFDISVLVNALGTNTYVMKTLSENLNNLSSNISTGNSNQKSDRLIEKIEETLLKLNKRLDDINKDDQQNKNDTIKSNIDQNEILHNIMQYRKDNDRAELRNGLQEVHDKVLELQMDFLKMKELNKELEKPKKELPKELVNNTVAQVCQVITVVLLMACVVCFLYSQRLKFSFLDRCSNRSSISARNLSNEIELNSQS